MTNLQDLSSVKSQAEADLLAKLENENHWVGEVELNPGPTAQAILLHFAVDRSFPADLALGAEHYFLRTQNTNGGWSAHYGEASDVSVSTEVFVAMRLLAVPEDSAVLLRAQEFIRGAGGVSACNPWTQLYLAFVGVVPWDDLFKLPIEAIFVPESAPFSFDRMAYWVKVISMPMALLGSLGPRSPLALSTDLRAALGWNGQKETPKWLVKFSKLWSDYGKLPFVRSRAQKKAFARICEFTENSGDFGGNTCTAMVVLLCLYRNGEDKSERFEKGFAALMSYGIWREHNGQREWHLQCCQSLVWDTGFALVALPKESQGLAKPVQWLKSQQILERRGDWSKKVTALPGAWCFGNRHEHFPVTDCSALAVLGISRHDPMFLRTQEARRARNWLLAMQHERGGWSAYEKYEGSPLVERLAKFKDIPNGLLDVPKADVTAKVVEALCLFRGGDSELENALYRARKFLLRSRAPNQLWRGNYGVNYIYGTSFAVKALKAVDGRITSEWAEPAADFFLTTQRADGGWGESVESYRNIQMAGVGDASSVVQSSWALIGLVNCVEDSPKNRAAVDRGLQFLLSQAKTSWHDPRFLGTVFPGAVYFRYELYEKYFPLMALNAVEEWKRSGHIL